jgi:ribonuclease BN (tRNA processing enzyme)
MFESASVTFLGTGSAIPSKYRNGNKCSAQQPTINYVHLIAFVKFSTANIVMFEFGFGVHGEYICYYSEWHLC